MKNETDALDSGYSADVAKVALEYRLVIDLHPEANVTEIAKKAANFPALLFLNDLIYASQIVLSCGVVE